MKEVESYIINCETLLILSLNDNSCKVFEFDDVIIVKKSISHIIKDSCLYFGSSLDGRKEGTKSLINCEMKVPIIIEDSQNLIFFPTSSYRNSMNIWVSYNNLLKYSKNDNHSTTLFFKQNNDIVINIKYNIIDNQVIRCIKLDAIINKRKQFFNSSENL